jgi:hypothetical protein
MMVLNVHVRGATSYEIGDEMWQESLADAIRAEAESIAADAGADLLESPDQAHRDALRDRLTVAMTAALAQIGDQSRTVRAALARWADDLGRPPDSRGDGPARHAGSLPGDPQGVRQLQQRAGRPPGGPPRSLATVPERTDCLTAPAARGPMAGCTSASTPAIGAASRTTGCRRSRSSSATGRSPRASSASCVHNGSPPG